MDFKDVMKQISERVEKVKENLLTEEATKNALVLPFLQAMGYDVFNPLEVLPEYICDIGTKKGEKIDYAIFKNGQPVVLIECKHWQQDLTLHDNQLLRYFHVSKARFGILTNGIIYRFYADLETPNKMDEKPFMEINMSDLKPNLIEDLKQFHKAYFDVENILSSANELKYTSELKSVLNKEFANPSPEFVKLLSKQVYSGTITARILEQFTVLVRKSISGLINDTYSDKLKAALKSDMAEAQAKAEDMPQEPETKESKINTTDEELESFYIIKSILRPHVGCDRITYRDSQSYFAIIFDDNNRKPICRMYLNSKTSKYIAFIGDDKKETKHKIESIDDIYNYSDQLIDTVSKYIDTTTLGVQ